MSTQAQPGVPSNSSPTLEQKLDDAAVQASQVVAAFSQPAAVLIQSGVAIEPVISGIVKLVIGLFAHHAKQAVKGS